MCSSDLHAAYLTAWMVGVNIIGNVFGGWLVHRKVRRGAIIAGVFVLTSLIFVAIFSLGLSDGARYGLILVYSIVCGPIPAAALSGGARYARSPSEVGTIQGLIFQLTNVGLFFGPPVTAMVVRAMGSWDAVLWVLLGAGVLGFVAALGVLWIEMRSE